MKKIILIIVTLLFVLSLSLISVFVKSSPNDVFGSEEIINREETIVKEVMYFSMITEEDVLRILFENIDLLKGDKGEKGEKGDNGSDGEITYIENTIIPEGIWVRYCISSDVRTPIIEYQEDETYPIMVNGELSWSGDVCEDKLRGKKVYFFIKY